MVERARTPSAAGPDDAGFTLVEMIVAMAVFLVFLAIITSSVISITAASSRAQLIARTSNGVLVVFQNLDRQIRYADSINFPGAGATAGSRYVEFRIAAGSAPSSVATCVQWRYWPATKSIQSRQWPESGTPSPNWATKVTNVIDTGAATYPFQLMSATTSSATQRLVLSISSGTVSLTSGASISSTFVARNSSILSPSNSNTKVAGVSDTPVCTSSGSRP